MHNNYYFLRQLTASLRSVLPGTIISECYSQTRDEVVLRFETHGDPFYLRANVSASLATLSFPSVMERAKKNSIDLFPGIIGYRVTGVRQFDNERSLAIDLEDDKILLFKMHGNRSNLVLFSPDTPPELFRKNLPADGEIDINRLDRAIDWSYEAFLPFQDEPEKLYFTFGKMVWLYLRQNGFFSLDAPAKWEMISNTVQRMESPSYFLTPLKNSIHLTLLPFENSVEVEGTALDAANRFFYAFTQEFALEKEKGMVLSLLKNRIASGKNYYEKNFQKLAEIENDTSYRNWGDLVMANMHTITPGMESVTVKDFYRPDREIEIRLRTDLSPQANAALFYRKAKNQHIEIDRLQKSLEMKEKEIQRLETLMSAIQQIDDLKTLRRKMQTEQINPAAEKQPQLLPYHEFVVNGFRIWVGKNAESNDELTLKYSYKEDLWLHAKDVTGSHVLIKHQSGKKFPKDVIERAAELAAYNSKRKTDSLCPVVVTPKKYVRKRKGDPAGAVVVEREDVIMVEPRL